MSKQKILAVRGAVAMGDDNPMLANNILPRTLMKHPRPIVERLKKHTLLAGLLIMLPANAQCQNAPPALKGKSIIIAWMENRTQRNANQARLEM